MSWRVDLDRAFFGMPESELLRRLVQFCRPEMKLFTLVGVMLNNADSVTSAMELAWYA